MTMMMLAILSLLAVGVMFGTVQTGDDPGAPADGQPPPQPPETVTLTKAELEALRKSEYARGAETAVRERFKVGDPKTLADELGKARAEVERLTKAGAAQSLEAAQQHALNLEKRLQEMEATNKASVEKIENERRQYVRRTTIEHQIQKLQAAKKMNPAIPAEHIARLVMDAFEVGENDTVAHKDDIGRLVDPEKWLLAWVGKAEHAGYAYRLPSGTGTTGAGHPAGGSNAPATADADLRAGLQERFGRR